MCDDIPDGLADIRRQWTFVDLLEAHIALDAVEDLRMLKKAL